MQRHEYFSIGISHPLLYWGLVGLVAGWLTGKLTRGRGFGCIADVLIGLVGAFIGGWVFTKLGVGYHGMIGSIAAATVGAVLLVSVARLVAGRD